MVENSVEEIYYVNEYFYSLQGEGVYSGQAAFFIRLAGCNVKCAWCDSPRSWRKEGNTTFTANKLRDKVLASNTKICVITGGEPMLHNLKPLTEALREAGVRVHLETSGSEEFSGVFDWITLSPKKQKQCRDDYFSRANELKIIIESEEDFAWAEKLGGKTNSDCVLLMQSEWTRRERVYPLVTEYIMKHNNWRLSLQTHKYINID